MDRLIVAADFERQRLFYRERLFSFLLSIIMGLCCGVLHASAAEMSFRLAPLGDICGATCPLGIAAEGEITETTPDAFLAFVQANTQAGDVRSIVLLNSEGGKVVAAMEFGHVLRRLGAAIIVARTVEVEEGGLRILGGRCYSACVYALMGGRKRVIPPESAVAVHRMFAPVAGSDPTGAHFLNGAHNAQEKQFDNGDMREKLVVYARMMGVNREIIDVAEHTPSESVHILSRAEITRWKLGQAKF